MEPVMKHRINMQKIEQRRAIHKTEAAEKEITEDPHIARLQS
jgi:hypothetical protein